MRDVDWSGRVAGALVVTVGALNLVIGVLSLTTDLVRLSVPVAGGFVAVGLATTAVGALVWRGSRPATFVAFVVFTMLLVFQVSDLVADTDDGAAGPADQPVPRLVVLALLVVTSGLAAWRLRRSRTPASSRR